MTNFQPMGQPCTSPGAVLRLAVLAVVSVAFLGLTSVSKAADTPDVTQVESPAARIPGEVLVRFTTDSTPGARADALDAAGADGVEAITGIPRARRVALEPGQSINEALDALRARDDIAWAQPNLLGHISAIPDDPDFGQLWAFRNTGQIVDGLAGTAGADIGATEAWDKVTGGNTKVAVIDTGVDPTNPDIAPNLDQGLSRNFAAPIVAPGDAAAAVNSGDWADQNGHGTHVAGTIAAAGDNGIGVAGVNWTADLIAVRACDFDGYCDSKSVAEAMAYAGQAGARVANVSLGFSGDSIDLPVIKTAISDHPRTLSVAAAGNEQANNDNTATWPCNIDLPNVVCVAATDQNDQLADYSNYGATTVDLGAPGDSILSTVPNIVEQLDPDLPNNLTGWTQAQSGFWTIQTTPGGNKAITYAGLGASATITSPAMDFTGGESCSALYYFKGSLHNNETFDAQVSTDNGATWRNPGPYSAITSEDGLDPTEFTELSLWMGDADGESQVKVRFVVDSNPGDPTPAVQVTQPTFTCIEAQPGAGTYDYYSGTSMATPETTGAATLVFSGNPSYTVADVRQALLSTVDPLSALSGKTITGGRLDLDGAVNYQAPVPPVANNFSVVSVRRTSNGRAVLRIKLPGAGRLQVFRTARVVGASRTASARGVVSIKVRARGQALRQLRRTRKVRVAVKLGFRPTGGSLKKKQRSVKLARRS